jgi:hypothetical protein
LIIGNYWQQHKLQATHSGIMRSCSRIHNTAGLAKSRGRAARSGEMKQKGMVMTVTMMAVATATMET